MTVECTRCEREVRIPDGHDPRLIWHRCIPVRRTRRRWTMPSAAISREELVADERLAWAQSQLSAAIEDALPAEAARRTA